MATICRSDIHSYHGHRPNPCPGILGHEIIGAVEQLGAGIHSMTCAAIGIAGRRSRDLDRVFPSRRILSIAISTTCRRSLPGLRKYGHDLVAEDPHFLGGFADYCYIMPGTGILKLPDELSDEEATPLNCGVATMVAMVEAASVDHR